MPNRANFRPLMKAYCVFVFEETDILLYFSEDDSEIETL